MKRFAIISGFVVLVSTFALSVLIASASGPGPDDAKSKSNPKASKTAKKPPAKKKKSKFDPDEDGFIRWGRRPNESDEKYDKRYAKLVKSIKQDKQGDFNGGHFENAKGEKIQLWTYMGHPFIVRSDIDAEFTADTAMYMEMLHREYGEAYKLLLGGIPADVREKIEVIVFADRGVYMKNGGTPGSGGFFSPASHLSGDRGPHWPARRYRLQQFTDGIKDFKKWPKGTLKHEAAHMEIQLRLGNTLFANVVGFPVDCPRWWNEGHASVFEYWDFDLSVEENFKLVPYRGRYAPFIRRIYGTDKWKDFKYVWQIDPQSWHRDMTTPQGYLNYCQAWSLAAYMMSGGTKGQKDFRTIFDLSKRVGADRQTTYHGDRTRAWEEKFPIEQQRDLEKNWEEWVASNVSRDRKVDDEEYYLRRAGYNPEVLDSLERFSEDEIKKMREGFAQEDERRNDPNRIEK